MARSAVLLKTNVASILLFNFCEQKFVEHCQITISIDGSGLPLLIFKEKWSKYASGLKFVSNRDSFWVRQLFNVCVRVFCVPNAKILFVYIPTKKWSFIWKYEVYMSFHHLAMWKRIGWSIGFKSWTIVIRSSLYKICLSDVSKMFNCCERRLIYIECVSCTLSAIFSGVRIVIGFSPFVLSMRMTVSYTFFTR